jgi:hypothetical protein
MRRLLILSVLASAAGPAALGASVAAGADPPRAILNGFVCRTSATALNRAISITAVMRPVSGTERMALKFELQRRAAGTASFADVSGGDLGKWIYPADPPTLGTRPDDVWKLDKQVVNLASAVYRFRVTFRWIGAGGSVLGTAVRRSPRCDQP